MQAGRCHHADDPEQLGPRRGTAPHELIIYGGNGAIFQNWAQYSLVMQYLANMDKDFRFRNAGEFCHKMKILTYVHS